MSRRIVLFLSLIIWVLLTTFKIDTYLPVKVNIDIDAIRKRGKLIAVTNYSTTDYFVFKGTPMGFQFELLRHFAEYTGLELEILVKEDINEITRMLMEGRCDIVAMNIPVTGKYKQYLSFTDPIIIGKQVIVQCEDSDHVLKKINSILELDGKTVVVQKGSAYAMRLRNIALETGQHIEIIEVPENEEQLIQFVASGEIDYTITNEWIAQVNKKYFPQLNVSVEISMSQPYAWATRKNAVGLLTTLNQFFQVEKQTSRLAILKNKYYQNQWANYIVNSDYFVLNSGQLSPYDDLIRRYSEELNWDWRLLAAIIYEESKFNPESQSHRGAIGLMQLMPTTAMLFGADSISLRRPNTNIAVGVKYLKWLDKKFEPLVKDKDERIKFVLAAYNIGIGHIFDAQLLAKKYGKSMTNWNDVKEFLRNKSLPKYYTDPDVKFGFCVGRETEKYVSQVLNSYMHYKNLTHSR